MNKIINDILCEIKMLKQLFSKKIKLLFNNIQIEDDITSLNFTGDGVSQVITNSAGQATVVIEGGSGGSITQIQTDYNQMDSNAVDFLKNKPIIIPSWNLSGNSGTNPSTSFVGTLDNQDVAFRRNNIEAVRIANNNRVGVGITNPTSQLHVFTNSPTLGYSLSSFENNNNDGLAFMSVRHTGTNISVGISATGNNYVPAYDAHNATNIVSNGPARYFRIVSNGDVDNNGDTPILITSGGFYQVPQAWFTKDFVRLGKTSSNNSFFEPNQITINTTSGNMGVGLYTPTSFIDIKPSTTTDSQIRLRAGANKTSPNNGDIWFNGQDLKMQIAGETRNFAFENVQNTYFLGNYDIVGPGTTAISENYTFIPGNRYRITSLFHIDVNPSNIVFAIDVQFIHIPATFTVNSLGYVKIESYIDYIDSENVISSTTYSNFGGLTQNSGFKALNVIGGITNTNVLRYQITAPSTGSVFYSGTTVEKL